MRSWDAEIIYSFFISLGVVMGGSIIGSFGALAVNDPPMQTMSSLATRLKIWAVATALGGTFGTFESIDTGLFKGQVSVLLRQLIFLMSAYLGAHVGQMLVTGLSGSS